MLILIVSSYALVFPSFSELEIIFRNNLAKETPGNVWWKIRIYAVSCWCMDFRRSRQCAENMRGSSRQPTWSFIFLISSAFPHTHMYTYRTIFARITSPVLLSHRRSSQKYLSLRDKREYHGMRPKRIMTLFLHLHTALLFSELNSCEPRKMFHPEPKIPVSVSK